MSRLLDKVIDAGFSGILNCPTLALVDGLFRLALEENRAWDGRKKSR